MTLTMKTLAIGLGDCVDQTEETVTDEKGNFKIIGLTQGCSYGIKIQSNEFLISPSTHQIKIDQADATNIEFSAFKGKLNNVQEN